MRNLPVFGVRCLSSKRHLFFCRKFIIHLPALAVCGFYESILGIRDTDG